MEYEGIPLEDLSIENIDWFYRSEHIRNRSKERPGDPDIEPEWASEAALDDRRLVALTGGRSIAIVGLSPAAGFLIKVWLVPRDLEAGEWWGASACRANRSDELRYRRERHE